MVSIKDIARKCGVSVATVSKALNNQPDVGNATKNKIAKVAEEMGYMANSSARALKTNRTYNIGILLLGSTPGLAHEYFSNVLESFKQEAEDNGYDITFINDVIAGKKVSYKKHCVYRNLDGVVIITADYKDKEIIDLASSDIPCVTIDYSYENCASVLSDNITGMSKIVEYVIKMGHKKIAYIHGEDTRVSQDRLNGFYNTLRKHKITIPDEYVVEAKYHSPELAREKLQELLKLKNKPTCIIFPDDYSTISSINDLKDNKISYVGYDGIEIAKILGLTTYEQNKKSLGKIAAIKLIEQIEKQNNLNEHVLVSGRLIEGKSVRKI